jgi:Protein of unknown function (DUF1036)
MLKLCKVAMSICLNTPLFVFMSTISNQPSAHAWMKFCNKKNEVVQIAYSRYRNYVAGGDELTSEDSHPVYTYAVKGWYTVNPGDCVTVSDLSATRDAAPGQKGYFSVNHYYHMRTANRNTSSGKDTLCIKDGSQFETKTTVFESKVKCLAGFYPVPFKKISPTKNNYTLNLTPTSTAASPPACKQGYVFREAGANDRVCVTPQVRAQTGYENAVAASRREANGGPYGPDTCKQGYVWREAIPNDRVCVTPEVRSQAAEDNQRSTDRRVPKG